MSTFEELRAMYDRGQTEDVLRALSANPVNPSTEESDDLITLKGWCHYRRKEFDEAHECAKAGGNHQWSRELMAYLCAYVPKYVNDEKLREIANELGNDNINIANAFVIRARASDCSLLTRDKVHSLTGRFAADKTVHGANLFHNAGRYFLAKGDRHQDDFREARNRLSAAINRYESWGATSITARLPDSGSHRRARR